MTRFYIVPVEDEERNIDTRYVGQIRSFPELIHCRECKHSVDEYDDGECYCNYKKYLRYIKEWDHYCAWAERKEE